MPKTRKQKEESVVNISQKLSRSKSVVFTDYKGMTMSQLSQLRVELRKVGAEFGIVKNSLLKIALKESEMKVTDDVISGPTAILYSFEDEITPIKALTKALKDNQIGEIKGGLLDMEPIDASRVKTLATLPTKDELRAKVVGALGSPLYGIVGVLQANLRNLVYALEQIRKQKGGE